MLWRRGPSLAADVAKVVNRRREAPLAYTTVLNVLLNLKKKDAVDHTAEGRAYRFAPKLSEAELRAREAKKRTKGVPGSIVGRCGCGIRERSSIGPGAQGAVP